MVNEQRKAFSPMNSVSDSLLTPSTGPVPVGQTSAAQGGHGDSAADGGGFAAVLGQVRDGQGGGVQVPGELPGASPDEVGDATAQGQRQEVAAAFAIQWAALLSGSSAPAGSEKAEMVAVSDAGEVGTAWDHERAGDGSAAGADTSHPAPASVVTGGDALIRLALVTRRGAESTPPGHAGEEARLIGVGLESKVVVEGATAKEAAALAESELAEPAELAGSAELGEAGARGPANGQSPEPLDGYATGLPYLPMPQVVALQISPQLEVITAGVSTASDDSLRAYAAAQGFDAVALQRMFGSGASASGVDPVASGSAPVSPGGNVALAAGTSLGFGVATGQMPVAPSDAVVDPAMAPSTSATPGPVSPHLQTIDGQISPTVVKSQDSLAVALERFNADGGRMATRRSELGASPIALDGSRLAGAAVALAAGAGASAAAATPAGASTSAWLALQARQVSDSWVGARVVDSSGVGALTAPLTPALSSVGAAEGAAMPTALSVHLADAPASGSRPEAVPRPVDAQPLDLRDHLENTHEALSKRLGEALATRLLAQVDKGDWQIRLTVTPQHLGPIDIDLQVKGQRLEAQFQVAHGQTQAMIQDSLPRLREAVSASGMDLASVWVSGGWNERNRGNPTPGQPDDPVPLALNEGGGEQAVGGAPPRDPRGLGGVLRPGAVDILI